MIAQRTAAPLDDQVRRRRIVDALRADCSPDRPALRPGPIDVSDVGAHQARQRAQLARHGLALGRTGIACADCGELLVLASGPRDQVRAFGIAPTALRARHSCGGTSR